MTRWCARTLLGVTLGFVLWAGCSVDDARYNFGDEAGAAGVAGARLQGASGAAGKGATGGRGSTPSAGGFASGVGGSFSAAGSAGNAAPGGVNGQGAVSALGGTNTNPAAGTAGTTPSPAGVCVAGTTEPCGDCGTRTCDSVRLDWNACIGTGTQQDCWETPEGAALPGEMPTDPKGKCTVGGQTCQADGTWSACTGAVAPAAGDDCSVAGDDSNCSGMPNDGCNCSPGMMRACGTDAGNCQQGQQVCTANTWGPCVGEVKPVANDSCLVTGDDGTCNGLPNEGCLCVADNPMACNDNVACTDNVCTNGVCSNPTSAGFCRIGGQCYSDGASEPGNPCRFCDADVNRSGWSNSPSSVRCDDGQWCNGNDVCSAGSCTHEFTTNRCTASGPCALSVCDEARDSCFRPNTFDCSSNVETRCASSSCGADVQNRTVARKCSGSSAACDGATSTGNWTASTDCSNNQVCQASGSRLLLRRQARLRFQLVQRRPVLDDDQSRQTHRGCGRHVLRQPHAGRREQLADRDASTSTWLFPRGATAQPGRPDPALPIAAFRTINSWIARRVRAVTVQATTAATGLPTWAPATLPTARRAATGLPNRPAPFPSASTPAAATASSTRPSMWRSSSAA